MRLFYERRELKNGGGSLDALLITNGVIESTDYLSELVDKNKIVICADGAVRYLRSIKRLPSCVIGDLDSIDQDDLDWINNNEVPIVLFDTRKDYTDTELAVRYALEKGSTTITLTGAIGGRLDHSLGNLYLLVLISQHNCAGVIIEKEYEIRLITKRESLNWGIGETVSFVPVSETVKEVTVNGFEYPLEKENLYLGHTRSISNIVSDENQMVEVGGGMLLAIRNK